MSEAADERRRRRRRRLVVVPTACRTCLRDPSPRSGSSRPGCANTGAWTCVTTTRSGAGRCEDLDGFWSAIWDFFGVVDHGERTAVLSERIMPGARWFPGSRLNYAEHALRGAGADDAGIAVRARSQTRPDLDLTWGELRAQVARARQVLVDLGVRAGDRVAGYLPNCPEALVAFLAAAGLGAVWTSCALEFGPRSVIDRFGQVEPVVLLVAGGYRYGRKDVDRARRGRRGRGRPAHCRARARHRVRPVAGRRMRSRGPSCSAASDRSTRRDDAGALRPSARRPVLLRHHRQAEGDRARPRRHRPRAPEEPRAVVGPRPR